jgi:TetR/AcrR family transcriptional repressor of nem operon
MGREQTRDVLLEAGRKTFLEKGYTNSGIEAILNEAGVPKGSFYYYFESKEDFGLKVLDHFAARHDEMLDRFLGDDSVSPLERLRNLAESLFAKIESEQGRKGCLVGRLSQEMADQSEAFRARLAEIFEGWVDRYAKCLSQAQQSGQIDPAIDVRELAEFWLNSWQGALLRAKTMRSNAPLRAFLGVMFGKFLRSGS